VLSGTLNSTIPYHTIPAMMGESNGLVAVLMKHRGS